MCHASEEASRRQKIVPDWTASREHLSVNMTSGAWDETVGDPSTILVLRLEKHIIKGYVYGYALIWEVSSSNLVCDEFFKVYNVYG